MASTRLYGPTVQSNSPATPPTENTVATGIAPLPATLAADTTAEQIVLNPTNGQPLLLQIPSGSPLEGKPFDLTMSGRIVSGGSLNVTMTLYQGTSATPGNDGTPLGSSSTVAQHSLTAPFWMHAKLILDSTSGKLNGVIDFLINNTVVASTAIAAVTGLSNANNPVASFCVSFTFSVAETTNLVVVEEFAINF